MDWSESGYILSVRKHGETSAITHIFTRNHGRHAGLVRGGVSRRIRPILQPGNKVDVEWRARLSEHLGTMTVEALDNAASLLMEDRTALSGLNAICAMAMMVIPEREVHEDLYDVFETVVGHLHDPDIWPALYARWEAGLLVSMGYGLDLSTCAASGATENLTHVSPRSGRAVSESEAEPYLDKLLRLPQFLRGRNTIEHGDIADALSLTGHFIETRILWPTDRQMPEARARMIARLMSEQKL